MTASHAVGPAHGSAESDRFLVLTVIGAAVLCGLGLFGTFYWLLTFNWLFFPSVGVLMIGAYLLFTRVTGTDHA
jgi:hypothetical protein